MDELDFANVKPRKSLVKQAYDTGDNPIKTVGGSTMQVRYKLRLHVLFWGRWLEVRLWLCEKIL